MDIHAQYLDIAGLLRASALVATPKGVPATSVAAELTGIADEIDPHGYSPATVGVTDPLQGIADAVAKLDGIPGSIRPTTADPMREHLVRMQVALR